MKEQSSTSRLERDRDQPPQRSQSSAATLTSLGADISPSSSHFFEVNFRWCAICSEEWMKNYMFQYLEGIFVSYADGQMSFSGFIHWKNKSFTQKSTGIFHRWCIGKIPGLWTWEIKVFDKQLAHRVPKTTKTTQRKILAYFKRQKRQSGIYNHQTYCSTLFLKYSFYTETWSIHVIFSKDSSASELGSIENISSSSVLSPTSPFDVAKTLGGSVETLAPANNNSVEHDGTENVSASKIPKNANTPSPEMMRNRAASTGSVLTARRDSTAKGGDEYNRTMLFQVCAFSEIATLIYKLYKNFIILSGRSIWPEVDQPWQKTGSASQTAQRRSELCTRCKKSRTFWIHLQRSWCGLLHRLRIQVPIRSCCRWSSRRYVNSSIKKITWWSAMINETEIFRI